MTKPLTPEEFEAMTESPRRWAESLTDAERAEAAGRRRRFRESLSEPELAARQERRAALMPRE